MIIQFFFFIFLAFNYKIVLNIFSFFKILFTLILFFLDYKINNKPNKTILLNLYNQVINSDCYTIKFTQWIISRIDMFYIHKDPPEWLNVFYNIYENCNSHNIEYTESVFNSDFPNYLTFYQFVKKDSLELVGSGSIGQVYKAENMNGEKIAIKCKHPNIDNNFFTIYYFLSFIHFIINNIPIIKNYLSVPINLENFFNSIKSQTDFNQEAKNMKKIYHFLKDEDNFIVPKCIMNSRNIIIMSYEEGEHIEKINISSYGKNKIALMLLLLLRNLVYIKGFLHGDLHQGNWKVKKISENEYKLILFDFGICCDFSEEKEMLHIIRDFFFQWDKGDYKNLVSKLKYFVHYSKYSLDYIEKHYFSELEKILKKESLRPINVSSVAKNIFFWCTKHGIVLNSIFLDIMLTSSLVEKTFKEYGIIGEKDYMKKDFNVIENCFKSDWLDWINFMNTYKCFPELNKYMQTKLQEENIEFDQLFYKIDDKIEIEANPLVMDF